MSVVKTTPQDVIEFWYTPAHRKFWFASTPEMDEIIRSRFETTWEAARSQQLDHWQQTPEGCLALTIVLDQFPLNMYRNTTESFATEQQAVAITRHAITQGFDQQLPGDRLAFLYMPLMHSEHLDDQNESVRLFSAAGLQDNARFARHHRDLIRRFGRFPHRNIILGRTSTPEEIEYLESDKAFKG